MAMARYNPSPSGGIRCTLSDRYEGIEYPHYHREYELSLILGGEHLLQVEREEIAMHAGHLALLHPGAVHSRRLILPGQYVVIVFPPEEMERLAGYLGEGFPRGVLGEGRPTLALLSPTETDRVKRQIERVNLCLGMDGARALAELRLLLMELAVRWMAAPAGGQTGRTPWLERLLIAMRDPENLRAGLDALLETAPYSHGYVCREFRRMLGCTPTEYVNGARLERARRLLEETEMEIVEICYEVGFDSISYFYRLFKDRYDGTPFRYRKLHRLSRLSAPPEQRHTGE